MDGKFSAVPFLRELAGRQGVEPTDDDLEAVLDFLERILPALEDLEGLVPADIAP